MEEPQEIREVVRVVVDLDCVRVVTSLKHISWTEGNNIS